MRLLWARTPEEADAMQEWVSSRVAHSAGDSYGPSVCAGVVSGNRLIAGVVFSHYHERYETMQLSVAATSPMWCRPDIVRGLLGYAFKTANVNKLWVATPHTNNRALRLAEKLGFKREATLRHHFGAKKHAVVLSMLRDEWQAGRWAPAALGRVDA